MSDETSYTTNESYNKLSYEEVVENNVNCDEKVLDDIRFYKSKETVKKNNYDTYSAMMDWAYDNEFEYEYNPEHDDAVWDKTNTIEYENS